MSVKPRQARLRPPNLPLSCADAEPFFETADTMTHEASEADLKQLAPYNDNELRIAVQRVLTHPAIDRIFQGCFPGESVSAIKERAKKLNSVEEFQRYFIDVYLRSMEQRTSAGISLSGLHNIQRDRCYLFISSHRDILLDSALLTDMLFRSGFATPQICLGDNLLIDPLVTDLVKMNKGITVKRDLAPRELLRWSIILSQWIRRTILRNLDSVWIAQQEGRSKDGNDRTNPGILKMLALTGEGTFVQRLRALNIIPVAVSYEYDPSDVEKAFELHQRTNDMHYKKKPADDVSAIRRGLSDQKGAVHIAIGHGIDEILSGAEELRSKAEQAAFVASHLDFRIRTQFKNFSSHYIAADLIRNTAKYQSFYSAGQRNHFLERLEKRLKASHFESIDEALVRSRVLSMYAATVSYQDAKD